MKLQRSTVILVSIALMFGAGVAISEAQRNRTTETAVAQGDFEPIFSFAEEDVVQLTVKRDDETLVFERDEDNLWQMTRPERGPAEAGAVAFLLSRLITDSPVQEVSITPDQQADFGFDTPKGTVEVTLKDGTTHTVILGEADFSGNSLYVLADPEVFPLPEDAEATTVYVLSEDVANGVNRPLEEWQMTVETEDAETTADSAEDEENADAGESSSDDETIESEEDAAESATEEGSDTQATTDQEIEASDETTSPEERGDEADPDNSDGAALEETSTDEAPN